MQLSNGIIQGIPPDSIAKQYYFYITLLTAYPTSMTGIIAFIKNKPMRKETKTKIKTPKKSPIHQFMMAKQMNLSNSQILGEGWVGA